MKKLLTAFFFFYLIFHWASFAGVPVYSDWWDRPEVRPSQPNVQRDLPTQVPNEEPTVQPTVSAPTVTLPVGGPQDPTTTPVLPTQTPGPTATSSSSSTGSDSSSSGGSSANTTSYVYERVGSPQVKGLSNTASFELKQSDIILLLGVLCLLIYLKSKLTDKSLV